jgi:hypothetical protein
MWGISILPLALAALPCNAITLHKRDDPAVFQLPISRSEGPKGLQKRSSKVASTALYNVVRMIFPFLFQLFQPVASEHERETLDAESMMDHYANPRIAKSVLHGEYHRRHPASKRLPQS